MSLQITFSLRLSDFRERWRRKRILNVFKAIPSLSDTISTKKRFILICLCLCAHRKVLSSKYHVPGLLNLDWKKALEKYLILYIYVWETMNRMYVIADRILHKQIE